MLRTKKAIIPIFALAIIGIAIFSNGVYAYNKLEPESATILEGFSVTFTFESSAFKNKNLTYNVENEYGSVVDTGTFQTDSQGKGTFSITFDDAGHFTVKVLNGSTVLATSNVEVIDIISIIVPILMLVIMITVVFKVMEMIEKELK